MAIPSFSDIIAKMEKLKIGTYCFEADCAEPGIDNVGVPLRRILAKMET